MPGVPRPSRGVPRASRGLPGRLSAAPPPPRFPAGAIFWPAQLRAALPAAKWPPCCGAVGVLGMAGLREHTVFHPHLQLVPSAQCASFDVDTRHCGALLVLWSPCIPVWPVQCWAENEGTKKCKGTQKCKENTFLKGHQNTRHQRLMAQASWGAFENSTACALPVSLWYTAPDSGLGGGAGSHSLRGQVTRHIHPHSKRPLLTLAWVFPTQLFLKASLGSARQTAGPALSWCVPWVGSPVATPTWHVANCS